MSNFNDYSVAQILSALYRKIEESSGPLIAPDSTFICELISINAKNNTALVRFPDGSEVDVSLVSIEGEIDLNWNIEELEQRIETLEQQEPTTVDLATTVDPGIMRSSSNQTNETTLVPVTNGAVSFNLLNNPGTIDLNDYRRAGEWMFTNITTATNFPTGTWTGVAFGAYLKVLRYVNDSITTQILYKRGAEEIWWRRSTNATTFTAWVRIDDSVPLQAGGTTGRLKFWVGTLTQYNAITTKDPNTQYNIL